MAGIDVEGLDVIDILGFVDKKRRKFIAILLLELESVLGKDTETYKQVRKLVLDSFNDYTRSTMRALFGDIEGLIMR